MNERFLSKAKRKSNNKWATGYYYNYESEPKTKEHNILTTDLINDFSPYEIDVNTLCRCTGTKDKNDKLIFEGDIVVVDKTLKNNEFNSGDEVIVRWDSRYTGFILTDIDFDIQESIGNYRHKGMIKVIGNIHD